MITVIDFKRNHRDQEIRNRVAWRGLSLCVLLTIFLCACQQSSVKEKPDTGKDYDFNSLAKSDIGVISEIHVNEARLHLQELMVKLYKRNPRELRKTRFTTIEENVDRLFGQAHNWHFEELGDRIGIDAVRLTFDSSYQGDRVFAFVAGLTSMIMSSYNYKTRFYLFDSLNPQFLYNSARNLEIAVWKLGHDLNENGELYLYSNSLAGETQNLSYERLFGKLISLQDTMAIIVSGKTRRTFTKVVQRMATAVFLPVF